MSGHSKWANIRVRKGAQDALRGKVFTRYARLIEIAAREGGGDPGMNVRLRSLIDAAKVESVPNANIDRAIKKGTGELRGEQMNEVLYAAYGPNGVACLIECLTDNKNRTLSKLRMIVEKHGGHFAETNSVAWMFERRGVVVAKWTMDNGQLKMTLDELELELIDFGAEDFDVTDDVITVMTGVADWSKIRDFLQSNGCEILSAGLQHVAKQKVELKDETAAQKVLSFIEAIEEEDDVSEVHTNAGISEEMEKKRT
ncbi:YebC/PmpR family DNA-binding transcriptional regulator [Candidatus Peregrinibacteria bacterium]|nr:YebC/PmpR family DNA-binding transcriptional regulator [Candidatus Peregrinibacteria bacterium]MBI3816551.1 YebC/PmpR family DNA-binding transcriptional regulator [Candidatus Peregrinibacteria bacterium]